MWNQMTGLFSAMLVALLIGCGSAWTVMTDSRAIQIDDPRVVLLTDFSDVWPDDPDRDVNIAFWLRDIRPLSDLGAGSVVVELRRRDGQWAAEGHRAAADYNERSPNKVEIRDLNFDGRKLTGTLRVEIHADSPRPGSSPNNPPFPFPAGPWDSQTRRFQLDPDFFELTLDASVDARQTVPHQPDRNAFRAPWRKDVFTFGGRKVSGTYSAEFRDDTVRGELIGGVAPARIEGRWGTSGNINVQPGEEGGMSVLARLPDTRVAADHAAHAWFQFPEPQDWSRYQSIRVHVVAPRTRNDATVEMIVRQADRINHGHNNVARLRDEPFIFETTFDEFGPEAIHRDQVTGIAIGVNNRYGVGDVAFTVSRIELVKKTDEFDQPLPPVVVTLDPNVVRMFENADTVPKGLFGFHDVGENNPRRARDDQPDHLEYMKLINPGYLRPLTHTGFTGNAPRPGGVFIERARAANATDNVVWCHTVDLFRRPEWMDQGAEPWANRLRTFYARIGEIAWTPDDPDNVLRRLEVWNEPFFWGRHINTRQFTPRGSRPLEDPSQYGYLPARLGAEVYSKFFLAAAEGARSTNPHVLMGGPSSPSFISDDFGFLKSHMSIFFEEAADEIDFLAEHHYGGLPEAFAAGYEVVTAWLDIKHGRRIPIYNTECNLLHAPAAATAEYNIRDILETLRVCPDVAVGRAVHALWNGYLRNRGEEHAFIWLSTLRGRMLDVRTDDEGIIAAASTPEEGKLVLLVFNRSTQERKVTLPKMDGFELAEALWLQADPPITRVEHGDTEGQVVEARPAEATRLVDATAELKELLDGDDPTMNLERRHGIRLTFEREGYQPRQVRRTTRHFADILLGTARPGETVKGTVMWRGVRDPRTARRATLRLITRDVQPSEGQVLINGRLLRIPASSPNAQQPVLQEVDIPVGWLAQETTLEFEVLQPEQFNGYRVWAVSIELEH
ncbi:MAG: hypothetical protein JJU36_11225 [Phycisphaeraceae bacterium]|nr:hypothetical protein [Phycisphaeraceae bacterium]